MKCNATTGFTCLVSNQCPRGRSLHTALKLVLASSRKLLSVGLAEQTAESVIRGYKGDTLYAEPAAHLLEDLELADVVDLVSVDRGADAGAGARAGGGAGAA